MTDNDLEGIGCGMAVALILVVLVVGFVLWPLAVMWAWNTFMVAVFSVPAINFLQALALTVLFSLMSSVAKGLGQGIRGN